jgi:hypothetical protein
MDITHIFKQIKIIKKVRNVQELNIVKAIAVPIIGEKG